MTDLFKLSLSQHRAVCRGDFSCRSLKKTTKTRPLVNWERAKFKIEKLRLVVEFSAALLSGCRIYDLRITIYEVFGEVEEVGSGYAFLGFTIYELRFTRSFGEVGGIWFWIGSRFCKVVGWGVQWLDSAHQPCFDSAQHKSLKW